jgi:hypothetical protein
VLRAAVPTHVQVTVIFLAHGRRWEGWKIKY